MMKIAETVVNNKNRQTTASSSFRYFTTKCNIMGTQLPWTRQACVTTVRENGVGQCQARDGFRVALERSTYNDHKPNISPLSLTFKP